MKKIYNDNFYKTRNRDTRYAAIKILKLVMLQLKKTPKSIIDVGCGVGTWLKIANAKYNAEVIVGLDGNYVPKKYLEIAEKCFVSCNLEIYNAEQIIKDNNGKFDLAICLEVAEHISKAKSEEFIEKLCMLSDIVLFSAAIPKQGGDGHVNEQRLSYWNRIFEKYNYQIYDIIRANIWDDKKIPIWYRNNIVLFCNREIERELLDLRSPKAILDIVHPETYEKKCIYYEGIIKEMERKKSRLEKICTFIKIK